MEIADRVVAVLQEAGYPAHRAFPGSAMPHLWQGQMAVQLERMDHAARTATVLVTVMMPVELGGSACEKLAVEAGAVLVQMGGAVVQEACRFDAYADGYGVQVRAVFYGTAVREDWKVAPPFTVELNEAVLPCAAAFRAEQAVDESTGLPLSDGAWSFRLEERFGWEGSPVPSPAEPFSVTVIRDSSVEIYEECTWTATQLENTDSGLRQIRSGVALRRAIMVMA